MDIAEIILDYIRALVWPLLVLGLSFLFRSELKILFRRISHVDLPGGGSLDFQRRIEEAKLLSEKVEATPLPEEKKNRPSIPLTEANARMLQVGLRPSPSGLDMSYYRSLAEQDPNVALAGLRIELEILARNLVNGFGVQVKERDSGTRLLRKLYDQGAITPEQLRLSMEVVSLCNSAAHGVPISLEQSYLVIDIAEVLCGQYLSWLSWGFEDDWQPSSHKTE